IYNRDFDTDADEGGEEDTPHPCKSHYQQVFKQEIDLYSGETARASILQVVQAVVQTLYTLDFCRVTVLPISDLFELQYVLKNNPFNLVVNLCESLNRDSTSEIEVVKVLEKAQVPFTGNSAKTMAICLDKFHCSTLLKKHKIGVPETWIIRGKNCLKRLIKEVQDKNLYPTTKLLRPLIVKPNQEDGSTGIDFKAVVHDTVALQRQVLTLSKHCNHSVLVQEYIDGREFSVALLGRGNRRGHFKGISEIDFSKLDPSYPKILNYSSKWDSSSPEYHAAVGRKADISPKLRRSIINAAQKTQEVLELDGYGRIDLRLDDKDQIFIIDVNPNCDLDPFAGMARTAVAYGLNYQLLLGRILDEAFISFEERTCMMRSEMRSEKII
ncbi:MAG: ATP-grasp domain-containing protein, partial [Oligoflexia bacterium]|nr:ATP-grasp domain-containing protein [Oligoflexia bacterium]